MRTGNRTLGLCVAVCCALFIACGGDDDSGSGSGGSGGNAGGGSGTGGSSGMGSSGTDGGGGEMKTCINQGDDNADCAQVLMNDPSSGDCAPKGECCHRASNIAKEAKLGPDDPLVLEDRLAENFTINHPKTIGNPLAVMPALQQFSAEANNALLRVEVPRQGGEEVNGPGKVTFGNGAYNCDGTYSFFGDKAAPSVDGVSSDAARWTPHQWDVTVDTSKDDINDRLHATFDEQAAARQFLNAPYFDVTKDAYPLDWEISFMGYRFTNLNYQDNYDCTGKLGGSDGSGWDAGGQAEVFTPIFGNNKSVITALGVTYCTLVSFGIGAANSDINCETEARCMPGTLKDGSGGSCTPDFSADDTCCPWAKLPDSLCPATADDQKLFYCHAGAKGNVNNEDGYPSDSDLNCTDTAPTSPLDPDKGATSNGQCCDPLGKSDTLPACNAFRIVENVVLSAVEITDKPYQGTQKNCMAQ